MEPVHGETQSITKGENARGDEESATTSGLPTSMYLIRLPLPSPQVPTQLVAHLTHFQGRSLMLWCGEANPMAGTDVGSGGVNGGQPSQTSGNSSLLVEERYPEPTQTVAGPPTGFLGREWAVAMSAPHSANALSTSLFRSNLDISKPMAARLAKRYNVPQLFLSLSLPDQLLAMLEGPFSDPLGGRALLLLEGSLGNAIKGSLPSNV